MSIKFQVLAHFGPYGNEREEQIRKNILNAIPLDQVNGCLTNNHFEDIPKKVLKVADVIGEALNNIGEYNKLDNKKQVVALIDDVREI